MAESDSNNDNPAPDISTSQEFFTHFQREESKLRSLIASLESPDLTSADRATCIEQCLAGITKLSNGVKDAAVFLPAYDQRTYAQGIKSLQERLQDARAKFAPKQKFAFKNARKNATTSSSTTAALTHKTPAADDLANPNEAPPPLASKANPVPAPAAPPLTKDKIVYISPTTPPSTSSNITTTSSPNNCQNCLITLPPQATTPQQPPLPSLTLRNLTSCMVLIPHHISGPIHLTNIHNTTLLLSCRQFRMHESSAVDVYLHVASRPIIEGSTGIRFAPTPEDVLGFEGVGGGEERVNCWDQVDDFGWLVFGRASPNWRVLSAEERLSGEVWTVLQGIGEGSGDEGLREGLQLAGVYSSDS